MTETLANGYSFENTQQELSNEYQHDRVSMVFKNLCIRARLVDYLFPMSKVLKIRVDRSGKKKKEKKRQKYL